MRCDPNQMVASYTSSNTYIFDIETGKQVLMLETKLNSGNIAAFYSTFLDFLEFQLPASQLTHEYSVFWRSI